MDKNIKAIEELRKSLNESRKENKKTSLLEMIYNDDVEEYENGPGYENVPELPHENQQGGEASQEKAQDSQASQNDGSIDPQIMDLFANIRHAVLDGLVHFEKKPYSREYDILSKLLKLVDQSVEFSNQGK